MTLCLNDHIEAMDGDALQRALAFLPQWRRKRALAYKHPQGQMLSALAYVELCRALALRGERVEKPHFECNAHGKPTLIECPDLHFSMSHCSQAVGCLVSDRPCGLDIERIRPLKPNLISRTMNNQEEKQIMASACPEMEFISLWTRKEAVFKLLGTGITDNLPDILTEADIRGISLHTICNPARGYVLSTALLDSRPNI